MKTIWKYPLHVTDEQVVEMPMGAKILSVGLQYGKPCLWVLVDPQGRDEKRRILIRGTGHPITEDEDAMFIGRVEMYGGQMEWHVFEGGTAP